MNVPGTIAKDGAPERFVLPQDADSATIGEDQICQIEDENITYRLFVDEQAQLVYIADIELTANRDYDPWVLRAMNSQHWSGPTISKGNGHANGKLAKYKENPTRAETRFRQLVKCRTTGPFRIDSMLANESGFC
jgi:hypothetical protein